jgi:hypothetical protein
MFASMRKGVVKMKPSEIKKGLQCCTLSEYDCNDCPLIEKKQVEGGCGHFLMENAFDYINQLEAKVERLEKIRQEQGNRLGVERRQKYDQLDVIYNLKQKLATAKLEAVKEYEKRLKEKKCHYTETEHTFDFDGVTVEDIDNVAKEMGVK